MATPSVLILCKDLFFSSQLNGAVQRAGFTPQTCLGMRTCLETLGRGNVDWVVIDLELENLDLGGIRQQAPQGCRLVAFGPHVHEAQLESAQQAGCDVVLTRGQISQSLAELLQRG